MKDQNCCITVISKYKGRWRYYYIVKYVASIKKDGTPVWIKHYNIDSCTTIKKAYRLAEAAALINNCNFLPEVRQYSTRVFKPIIDIPIINLLPEVGVGKAGTP